MKKEIDFIYNCVHAAASSSPSHVYTVTRFKIQKSHASNIYIYLYPTSSIFPSVNPAKWPTTLQILHRRHPPWLQNRSRRLRICLRHHQLTSSVYPENKSSAIRHRRTPKSTRNSDTAKTAGAAAVDAAASPSVSSCSWSPPPPPPLEWCTLSLDSNHHRTQWLTSPLKDWI